MIMFTKTRAFLSDERGQDLVEYSLLCVIIGAVVVAYLTGVGTSLHGILNKISSSLDTVDKTLQ
jgi:Flp pilus assembly pilin Flp